MHQIGVVPRFGTTISEHESTQEALSQFNQGELTEPDVNHHFYVAKSYYESLIEILSLASHIEARELLKQLASELNKTADPMI